MNQSEKIYNTVRELAKSRKIPLSEIIRECGLGQNFFVHWKKQGTLPRSENLQKIADYLEVSVDYLLGRDKPTDDDELNSYLEELRNREEMRMFFSLAKNATKEDVEAAVAMIEALKKRRNE